MTSTGTVSSNRSPHSSAKSFFLARRVYSIFCVGFSGAVYHFVQAPFRQDAVALASSYNLRSDLEPNRCFLNPLGFYSPLLAAFNKHCDEIFKFRAIHINTPSACGGDVYSPVIAVADKMSRRCS